MTVTISGMIESTPKELVVEGEGGKEGTEVEAEVTSIPVEVIIIIIRHPLMTAKPADV
jgi:hypothetical protein